MVPGQIVTLVTGERAQVAEIKPDGRIIVVTEKAHNTDSGPTNVFELVERVVYAIRPI